MVSVGWCCGVCTPRGDAEEAPGFGLNCRGRWGVDQSMRERSNCLSNKYINNYIFRKVYIKIFFYKWKFFNLVASPKFSFSARFWFCLYWCDFSQKVGWGVFSLIRTDLEVVVLDTFPGTSDRHLPMLKGALGPVLTAQALVQVFSGLFKGCASGPVW